MSEEKTNVEILSLDEVRGLSEEAKRETGFKYNHLLVARLCATVEHYAGLVPTCQSGGCSNLAACFGTAEGNAPSLACDECCGHGNEDGWCWPLADLAMRLSEQIEISARLLDEMEELHAPQDPPVHG